MNIPFTIFPLHFSQFPFSFPTFVVKPRRECLSPLIGVPWLGYLYPFNYPSLYCLFQYQFFNSLRPGFVADRFVAHCCCKFFQKLRFFCIILPTMCSFHVAVNICAFNPLIYGLWRMCFLWIRLFTRYGWCF